jgi:probable phosphoglycerate mutase
MEPHLFHPKDGESMSSVYKRSWEAVCEIIGDNVGKKIAIASHGCTIRNIMCHAMGKPIEELNSVPWADNTGVFLLRFSDDALPEIVMYNDYSHLPPELLPGKNRIRTVVYEKKDNYRFFNIFSYSNYCCIN